MMSREPDAALFNGSGGGSMYALLILEETLRDSQQGDSFVQQRLEKTTIREVHNGFLVNLTLHAGIFSELQNKAITKNIKHEVFFFNEEPKFYSSQP